MTLSWGYVAGYFDGEGNVNLHITKRGDWTHSISWFNTHLESLEEIYAFIGCGRVAPRAVSALGRKPSYVLRVTRKLDILRVLEHMEPLLIIKRGPAVRLREHLISSVDETRYENHGKVAALSDEELLRMYNDEQLSHSQIAERLGGLSASSITQAFRRRGLAARPAGSKSSSKRSDATIARMRASRRRLWADPAWADRQREMMRRPRVRGAKREVS
jgi:hypothetical protein